MTPEQGSRNRTGRWTAIVAVLCAALALALLVRWIVDSARGRDDDAEPTAGDTRDGDIPPRAAAIAAGATAALDAADRGRADEDEDDDSAWPPGLPDALTAEGYERQVRAAIADCAIELKIAGFDCDQPPCLARLRGSSSALFELTSDCAGWTEPYGTVVTHATRRIDCADGGYEQAHLLAPSDPRLFGDDPDGLLRLSARTDQLLAGWVCEGD